jgi:hypothetical protein
MICLFYKLPEMKQTNATDQLAEYQLGNGKKACTILV